MLKNYLAAITLATVCSGGLVAAQAPSGSQPQEPPAQPTQAQPPAETQPPADAAAQAPSQPATSTLTGCVYREQDVPGRAPNVAERAGVMEDYILAVAPATDTPSGTPGTVGTSGTAAGAMYKLELIEDDKLRAVVGKRVEVTGRIDSEAGDAKPAAADATTPTDRAIGRDRVNLPEFEVVSMREVEGTCPAKPRDK